LKTLLIAPIHFYQKFISPLLGPRCKYYPSCSSYTEIAIANYGIKGIAMGAWRIFRCNPWSNGGVDFVKGVPTNTQKTHERAPVLYL